MSLQVFNTRPDKYLENVQAKTILHQERTRCPDRLFSSFISNIYDPLNPAEGTQISEALLWLAFGMRERVDRADVVVPEDRGHQEATVREVEEEPLGGCIL